MQTETDGNNKNANIPKSLINMLIYSFIPSYALKGQRQKHSNSQNSLCLFYRKHFIDQVYMTLMQKQKTNRAKEKRRKNGEMEESEIRGSGLIVAISNFTTRWQQKPNGWKIR